MKALILAASLLGLALGSSAAPVGPYVTGGVSAEHLRYDVDGWVEKQLDKKNNRQMLDTFRAGGGTVIMDQHLWSWTGKVALGYQISPSNTVELGLRRYSKVWVQAKANMAGATGDFSLDSHGHTVSGAASASADARAYAELAGKGYSLSYIGTVYGPVFLRLGAEHVTGTLNQNVEHSASYQYDFIADGHRFTGSDSQSFADPRSKQYRTWAPLLGFGFELPITKSLSYRAEVEHVGIIREGVDFYSLTLKYTF